eukprot:COSAG03_NODE_663_length_6389_cov_11.967727_6_plen_79_part_00
MSDLTKLTKAQLINLIQEKKDFNFDKFKEQLNLEYETEQEYIDYIKKIQDLNAERLNDLETLISITNNYRTWRLNKLM